MAINSEKLGDILKNFVASTADIQGVAVISSDGLFLASSLPKNIDEERVSAMSVDILSLESMGRSLTRGTIDRIYIEGKEGFSILTSCGEEAVFLVMANKSAKPEVLMLEIKRALTQIKPALS